MFLRFLAKHKFDNFTVRWQNKRLSKFMRFNFLPIVAWFVCPDKYCLSKYCIGLSTANLYLVVRWRFNLLGSIASFSSRSSQMTHWSRGISSFDVEVSPEDKYVSWYCQVGGFELTTPLFINYNTNISTISKFFNEAAFSIRLVSFTFAFMRM